MAGNFDKQRNARLDAESGTLVKAWQGRVRVALVYPNRYSVGMANLGFQTVYRLLNRIDHVVCERVFLPDSERDTTAVVSIESARALREFDCVAFSLSFENDFVNILSILQKAELPLLSAHRGAALPLTLAGGVSCFMNPEPIAAFIDCFLLGEAEALLPSFFERFDPRQDRGRFLLEAARSLPGVYVPAFYQESYSADGVLNAFVPRQDVPDKVRRAYLPDIDRFATDTVVVTPDTGFADACLVEVSRGCPHGCRFCSAGYVYRPPRFRSLPQLTHSLTQAAERSHKVGLLGAAVSDLPELKALCELGGRLDLQLSFSSLRADALDDDLIAALKAGRLKTATIAPETGSERMRRVINKGLSESSILQAAEKLVAGGVRNLKLYFMVGLPTETQEDIGAVIGLVQKIKHSFLAASRIRGRMGEITVSLNTFVPKPFTPFQWVAMDSVRTLKHKIKMVQEGLKKVANVRVQADNPQRTLVQALLSRGDRRVADLLVQANLNNQNWPQTLKTFPQIPDRYVFRERPREELLPWDFIDNGLTKSFLWQEYQRALQAKPSPACPADPDHCRICGVCGQLPSRADKS